MKRRDGMKSASICFFCVNSNAPAMEFAVQLPTWPWSYTGGHPGRRSADLGRGLAASTGDAENNRSRGSGVSLTQPKRETLYGIGWFLSNGDCEQGSEGLVRLER